jgi:hypothetical protein
LAAGLVDLFEAEKAGEEARLFAELLQAPAD